MPVNTSSIPKWHIILVVGVLVGWLSWMSLAIIELDKDVSLINSNRFTDKDGEYILEKIHTHERAEGHPVSLERLKQIQVQLNRIEAAVNRLDARYKP